MQNSKKLIFVTGSSGVVGSILTTKLKEFGFDVREFDLRENDSIQKSGYSYNQLINDDRQPDSLNKLQQIQHRQKGNILHLQSLDSAMRGCCGIVHLAAVSRVCWGERNPTLCKSVNITGTENIINAAKKQPKPPWVLFISSREVYGQSAKLPVTEISPIQPCNIYGLSKAEAEKLIWQNRNRGFQSAILRFTNLYGSINDHPDRLIPTLVRKALLGETIYIDGEHRIFDFLHIEDAINGVLSTIAKLESEEYNLPTIQLVSGYAVSLSNLAEQIKKVTNSCSAICKRDAHKHDVTEFYGDSSLAYKFLRWSASIGLEDGLSRLANDFNKSFLMPSSIVTTHSNRTTNNQVTNSPIILDL